MKALLKEPLLHFLLFGAALFYLYSLTDNSQNENKISLPANKITQLSFGFEKTRQRKPNEQELKALISNYYKQQVAYKVGVEMGLLEGDGVIQKRIQQKVEFIVEDAVNNLDPSDEQLTTFLNTHSDDYRSEQIFSFTQLYFDPTKHTDITVKVGSALAQINALDEIEHSSAMRIELEKAQLLPLADNIYLDYQYTNISYALVARYFGRQFADSLVQLPLDIWQQEIKSGYGLHLVKLTERSGGAIQSLVQVRAKVKQDWLNEQRQQSLDDFYQALFKEYGVELD